MRAPLKIVLPISMGLVSAGLMAWDIHNQRVIESMGMAWDTGAPLWPYQTPAALLNALNLPADFVSNVVTNFFNGYVSSPVHYVSFFFAILALWWLIGLYLDRRSSRSYPKRRLIQGSLFCVLALALIFMGAEAVWEAVHWWIICNQTNGCPSGLALINHFAMEDIIPAIWCFAFSVMAILAAKRRIYVPAQTEQ
jgi:hypothetical protein